MLFASTAVSLIAPIGVQASEVNLGDMDSYSSSNSKSKRFDSKTFNQINEDLAILKGRVDGLEAKQNNYEAGSFSDTTTLDGKAIMWIGGVDGGDEIGGSNSVQTGYTYTMNLNTSFTGDDNLYVRLKGGDNGAQWGNKSTYHIETKDTTDSFKVDKIWYSFNVGDDLTAFVGPRIENYYMYITPSIYQPGVLKSMKLGGNSNFGASTDVGFGFKYENESGFGFASNIVSKDADDTTGMLGSTDQNKWDTQIAYTTDTYHLSLITALKYNGWTDSYYTTALGKARPNGNSTNYGLRGYWRPDTETQAVPEISAGYDISTVEGQDADTDAYFVGLTWKDTFQADDKIGIALGQPQTADTDTVTPFTWEAYYSYKLNDSITVSPAIFGATDRTGTSGVDVTGAVVQTTFKF